MLAFCVLSGLWGCLPSTVECDHGRMQKHFGSSICTAFMKSSFIPYIGIPTKASTVSSLPGKKLCFHLTCDLAPRVCLCFFSDNLQEKTLCYGLNLDTLLEHIFKPLLLLLRVLLHIYPSIYLSIYLSIYIYICMCHI